MSEIFNQEFSSTTRSYAFIVHPDLLKELVEAYPDILENCTITLLQDGEPVKNCDISDYLEVNDGLQE